MLGPVEVKCQCYRTETTSTYVLHVKRSVRALGQTVRTGNSVMIVGVGGELGSLFSAPLLTVSRRPKRRVYGTTGMYGHCLIACSFDDCASPIRPRDATLSVRDETNR
jgi:hypothetical protein